MRRPTNQWPKTPASSGTLFFAQAMQSFLDIEAFEGFRAYALDTFARIGEAIAIAEQISEGTLSEEVLKPVAKELAWSLKSDFAARSLAPAETELVIEQCEKKPNEYRRLLANLRILRRRIQRQYREALTQEVVARINDPTKRGELLAAIGFLVSHLINDGHDRGFIANRLKRRFFENDMKRVGAAVVRGFLNSIRDERNDYRVVHGVDDVTARMLDGKTGWKVVKRQDLTTIVQNAVEEFDSVGRFQIFSIRQKLGHDPYRAALLADEELERLKSFMIVPANPTRVGWSEASFVYRPRGTRGEILLTYSRPLQRFEKESGRSKFNAQQNIALFNKMDRAFDEPSRARLTRAIATASAATKTTEDEARLISLWSAFEILSSDPTETKIVHISSELVPCICIKYHRRVFAAVYGNLSFDYKAPFRKLIRNTVGSGQGGSYIRFAKFILAPEFENDRQNLLDLVSNSPAALHRLYRLEKLYGNPVRFRKSMIDHAERVEWQLKRVYRVRNSLIHAGESPHHIDALVTNALDYLRSCMMNLILVANTDDLPSSLDGTIAEIGLDWTLMQNKLTTAGKSNFTLKMIHDLMEPVRSQPN